MAEVKPIGFDPTGYEIITEAVKSLLNDFPGLGSQKIYFEEQGEEAGLSFFADAGALVLSERRSITDHVTQKCQYPFLVIYRSTTTREFQKLNALGFLESMGKWLCKEPVEIDGKTIRLTEYPKLSGGRKITRVTRSNTYGTVPDDNNTQDWILPVTIQYTYEFDL